MPGQKDQPRYSFKGYRFDRDTAAIIGRLKEVLRDPATGQPYSETDVIRIAVRKLAETVLPQ